MSQSLFDIPEIDFLDLYTRQRDFLLSTEEKILGGERASDYMKCMGHPLKDRKSEQDLRDGLIIFWHVYCHIYAPDFWDSKEMRDYPLS